MRTRYDVALLPFISIVRCSGRPVVPVAEICLNHFRSAKGVRSLFVRFRDSFGYFLVTFSDASVTCFVTILPNSFCWTPLAAIWPLLSHRLIKVCSVEFFGRVFDRGPAQVLKGTSSKRHFYESTLLWQTKLLSYRVPTILNYMASLLRWAKSPIADR